MALHDSEQNELGYWLPQGDVTEAYEAARTFSPILKETRRQIVSIEKQIAELEHKINDYVLEHGGLDALTVADPVLGDLCDQLSALRNSTDTESLYWKKARALVVVVNARERLRREY